MIFDSALWGQLMVLIGELAVLFVIGLIVFTFAVVLIASVSIRRGQYYFPSIVKSGLVLSEGLVKAFCKLFGLDDKEMIAFFIQLHNTLNKRAFEKIPIENRAIFFPQCLRNAECPAHLTPEGIICRRCGRCELGENIDTLENMGYHVWIAPGSTLIKRMIRKYRPKAIVGIGCLNEVKEGIEMADKQGIVALGVVTLKDGCVETLVSWSDVYETVNIGID